MNVYKPFSIKKNLYIEIPSKTRKVLYDIKDKTVSSIEILKLTLKRLLDTSERARVYIEISPRVLCPNRREYYAGKIIAFNKHQFFIKGTIKHIKIHKGVTIWKRRQKTKKIIDKIDRIKKNNYQK